MIKKRTLKFLITLASVIVLTALLILPAPAERYVALLCPGLFLSILTGITCGVFPAILTGMLPPVLAAVLRDFGLSGISWQILCDSAVNTLSGVMAAIVYYRLKTSVGAVISGILLGRIVFGVLFLVFRHLEGATYTLRQFAEDAFRNVWAGLLLSAVLIPVLIRVFRRYGLMKLLREEKMNV